MNRLKKILKIIGPGVITGAADDDPSGIATYSQTGAQFGYGQLWTAVFMLPFLIATQEACGRIGAVTGKGLSLVVKEHYSKKILFMMVLLVLAANIINIGADIGAMAAAAHLLVPMNTMALVVLFAILILTLEVFLSYKKYTNFLKWLCLSLLAYPITVFMVSQPWATIVKSTFVPHIEFNFQFLFIMTGVFGTTLSPYLFFWQAAQTVEEKREHHSSVSKKLINHLRIDNFMGMLFSEIVTWSIIVVAATILHAHGVTDIKTAADAAKALEPLVQTFSHAGYIAKLIFAIGIIGLGLLAVPVLAGSAAYIVANAVNIPKGLDLKFRQAKGFYSVIIAATLIGVLMNFIGINPMKALVYAAVINGVVAVPLLFVIALIARNKKIMGKYKSGLFSTIFVWMTFAGMLVAAVTMIYSFL